MKLYVFASLLLASCTNPTHWDWSGMVDMNQGRELYEAQRIQTVMENTK